MKQKFFTLLLGLAMVSVNAVAETVTVTISATVGAKSFVCDKDLDFSSFNSNASGTYDFNLVPYYVSGYNATTGNFALTRFANDQVPANTPAILLGKQHASGVYPGNTKSFDVPVITMAGSDANPAKRLVWANNYAWLVPVMRTSYNRSICLLDADGNENLDGEGNQIMNNVFFFNNEGITAGAKLLLNQTENVQTGVTRDTTISYTYYTTHTIPAAQNAYMRGRVGSGSTMPTGKAGGYDGTSDGLVEGDYCILIAPAASIWDDDEEDYVNYTEYCALFELGTTSSGKATWISIGPKVRSGADYNSETSKWFSDSEEVITSTPVYASYTQYFLGANGTTPVFKKCRADGTNGVNYGGAYVRVWSTLLSGAASRENLSFEIFDEDGTEISYQNDDVTGIRSLQNAIDANKESRQVYNLQGQKLDKMQRGLNIVGGKKYFVK